MKFYYSKIFTKPDAVFFDLDNTLYNYDLCHDYAINKISIYFLKKFKISLNFFFLNYEKSKKKVKKDLGNTASSHSRLLYFQRLFEILNMGSQIKKSLYLDNLYWIFFFKKMRLYNGVRKFLNNLIKNKVKLAIITDLTTQIQFKKIVYLKIDNFFENIVTSEEVIYDKPSKIIFDSLKNKNKNIRNIWFFGDSLEKDIFGAKKFLKAKTFHKINNLNKIYRKIKPDVAFNNFSDINNFYKNLLCK